MYGTYPVLFHDLGYPVSATRLTDFTQIAVNPAITVNTTAQCIRVSD
jgi:hypothetical protein